MNDHYVLVSYQIYDISNCTEICESSLQVFPRIKDSDQVKFLISFIFLLFSMHACDNLNLYTDIYGFLMKSLMQGGIMIFASSYFEFIRIRNFLKSQNASFCLLGE
jgi:hypothetical protein